MVDTKELAALCGVSTKSICDWAKRNGVAKKGYRWDFTHQDCQRLFEYYQVSVPLNAVNEPFEEKEEVNYLDESNSPSNEAFEVPNEANYEDSSTTSKLIEANEALVEAYKEQIDSLKEEIASLRGQLSTKDEQIAELISTNKALSASNAVQVVADKKNSLLAEPIQEKEKKGFFRRLFS